MAETIKNRSTITHRGTNKSCKTGKSNQSSGTNTNPSISYMSYLKDEMEEFERHADFQVQEIELNECFEFVAQLVDLFKHTVILSDLECEHDWHENLRHQLKQSKGSASNNFLDHKVENIAISKGLTKEQWNRLLYLTLTTGDYTEITTVSKQHLRKVRDMASRLLESDQQDIIFALINTIERYIPKQYLREK